MVSREELIKDIYEDGYKVDTSRISTYYNPTNDTSIYVLDTCFVIHKGDTGRHIALVSLEHLQSFSVLMGSLGL